jgi:hypothetical protein
MSILTLDPAPADRQVSDSSERLMLIRALRRATPQYWNQRGAHPPADGGSLSTAPCVTATEARMPERSGVTPKCTL